tara:strand:+ start:115501 stop:116760 length:1260 start_codon:yes stop_codon:yes gene_type:complete
MKLIPKLGLILLLLSQGAFASKALYSITPETSSTIQVPLNSTATINYRVQNQTRQTQNLSLQNHFGITQTVQPGFCDNPFTLAPNASCLLSLLIDGSKIAASQSVIGPEICKTNSSFFCSLPKLENRLNIEITSPAPTEDHILIANNGLFDGSSYFGFISDCLISDSGALENCQSLSDGLIGKAYGVAVSTSQYIYTANGNGENLIPICSLDENALDCEANSAGSLAGPRTVYIHNNYFYVISGDNNQVIKCDINPINGLISSCASTGTGFNNPLGSMAIANGYAYIPNSGNNTVAICSVDPGDGTLSLCSNFNPGFFIASVSGVEVSGSYAYIIGLNTPNVIACDVAINGTLSNCVNNTNLYTSNFNTGVAVLNDYLYINSADGVVEKCPVNGLDVTTCESTGSGFVAPAGNMTFITR